MGREVKGRSKFRMQAVDWAVAKLQGDTTASFCGKTSGCEVKERLSASQSSIDFLRIFKRASDLLNSGFLLVPFPFFLQKSTKRCKFSTFGGWGGHFECNAHPVTHRALSRFGALCMACATRWNGRKNILLCRMSAVQLFECD